MSLRTSGAPLRTYSKRKQQNYSNDTLKRRRVEPSHDDEADSTPSSDLPSSDTALFSDENFPPSTPPSSPPCPNILPVKNVKIGGNKHAVGNAKKRSHLVQMRLSFGQVTRRTCRDCGMEYVPSAIEDAALHKKFHTQHMNGLVLDRDLLRKANTDRMFWRGPNGAFIMALFGSQNMKPWSKKARAIFDMATNDLGAVDISDEALWGLGPHKDNQQLKASTGANPRDDRYKMYLYVDCNRCVGLCLAESIAEAYKVVEPKAMSGDNDEKDQADNKAHISEGSGSNKSLVVSEKADEAAIGISRIWTSKAARNQGIATALLNCVERTFRNGERTSKNRIAFSQPTELGTSLARRWFGKHSGWMIYVD